MSAEGLPTSNKKLKEEKGVTRRGFLAALGIGAIGIAAEVPSVFSKPEPSPEGSEEIAIVDRIRSWIEVHGEKYTIRREESDENGVYLLELEIEGEKEGETIEYSYRRRRGPSESASGRDIKTMGTRIDAFTFQDGEPLSGEMIALFNEETKEWEDQRSRPVLVVPKEKT